MRILIALLLLSACSTTPVARPPLASNTDYGNSTGTGGDVVVIPQWHLAPSTTTTLSNANLPQSENQRAIYRQLVDWVDSGHLHTVIVEGCEGEIANGFSERYNGWTLADLEKLSAEQLDNVITQIGIKLKAKLGRKVRVICGDNSALIKKHLLILSDMRGLVGFRLRIDQYKDDIAKRAEYVETARDVLKMPETADEDDVLTRIDDDLRARLKDFNDVLKARDASFVEQARRAEKPTAIVIGAIHAEDTVAQLEAAKFGVQMFTPRGLKGDEAEVLAEVQALLNKPLAKLPLERRTKTPTVTRKGVVARPAAASDAPLESGTPQPDAGPASK